MFKKMCLGLLAGSLCASAAWAQSPAHTNAADEAKKLSDLAGRYRNLAATFELGKSAGGRSITGIEIGSGDRSQKPALLVIGGVDPEDLSGSAASLKFASFLLEQSAVDSVKTVLDKYTVYVIPRLSPDPLESYFRKPLAGIPGNDQKVDADRDGSVQEDGPSDLNGDGIVSWMRVMDPSGEWIFHNDSDKLMRKADTKKGEVGRWLILKEGKDDDGDKLINEDGPGGVNVNKNFTYNYKAYQPNGGRHPFEAPEARAIGEFMFDRTNIIATFTFSYVDNINKPWRVKFPRTPGPNRFAADSIAHAFITNDVKSLAKYTGTEGAGGDLVGWAYWHAGKMSFGAPAWSFPSDKPAAGGNAPARGGAAGAASDDAELNALKWFEANDPSGFINWSAYTHPDFPGKTVEIGGFKPFALANAPTQALLDEAGDNATKLLFRLAAALPELEVHQPTVENLGGGVYRVTVTATNIGKLPTHTEIGVNVKGTKPVLIRTKLANGQKLSNGQPVTFIQEPILGGASISRTFLITGKGTVQFEVGAVSTSPRTVSVNLN